MEGVEVDDSRWPLVLIRARGRASVETAERLSAVMDGLLGRGERFAFVIDARQAGVPDARTRRVLAEFQEANQERFARFVVADATVVASTTMRGILRAISWLSPPVHPVDTFDDVPPALLWCATQLEEEGLQVPPP